MDWIKKHLVLIIVLVVVVVGGVWYGMSGGGMTTTPTLTTEGVASSGSPSEETADRDLVETLLTLRAITLSGTIFSDPAFKALQDFGTTIVAEPVGRDNPFASFTRQGQATPPTNSASPTTLQQPTSGKTTPRR